MEQDNVDSGDESLQEPAQAKHIETSSNSYT